MELHHFPLKYGAFLNQIYDIFGKVMSVILTVPEIQINLASFSYTVRPNFTCWDECQGTVYGKTSSHL